MKFTKLTLGIIVCCAICVCSTMIPPVQSPQSNQTSEETSTPSDSGLMDIIVTKDGEWNPSLERNRFRRDEFPDVDFFQWWFYVAKDLQTETTFIFDYYISFCEDDQTINGVMILFGMYSPQGNIYMSYHYPLSAIDYQGNYCQFDFGNGFTQVPVSDSEYHITGEMDNSSNIWTTYFTYPNVSNESYFAWDLSFNRIVGCMINNDWDDLNAEETIVGNIMAFDTLVNGSVTIDNTTYSFTQSPQCRGYTDMNWGQRFIGQPEDLQNPEYFWGWFTVAKYATDPANDVAMEVGIGVDDNIMGVETGMSAGFAMAHNVLGQDIAWKSVTTEPLGIGITLIEECSWGSSTDRFVKVEFTQSNFFTYVDKWGSAQVPAQQNILLEGEYVKIELDFSVTASDLIRLLAPSGDGIWSDFESLSATCNVKIYEKTYKWYDPFHFSPTYTLADQWTDNMAGYEFGYCVPDIVP